MGRLQVGLYREQQGHSRVNLVVDEEIDAPDEHSSRGVDQRAMDGGELLGH